MLAPSSTAMRRHASRSGVEDDATDSPCGRCARRQEEADELGFFLLTSSPPDRAALNRALVQEIDPNLPVNILMPLSQWPS